MYDFILGNLKLGNWQKGITTAASWAWGVSVIVGIQVFQQKGIEAFAIWAALLTLAAGLAVYKGTAWHAKTCRCCAGMVTTSV